MPAGGHAVLTCKTYTFPLYSQVPPLQTIPALNQCHHLELSALANNANDADSRIG